MNSIEAPSLNEVRVRADRNIHLRKVPPHYSTGRLEDRRDEHNEEESEEELSEGEEEGT